MTSSLLVAAIVAFVATTIDDLIIVTALFTSCRTTGRPRAATITAGQYLGFALIVGLSLAAAAGLHTVPDHWVGLLGLVPVGYGLWGLWQLQRSDDQDGFTLASTVTGIAAVTFANGADNIGVFTPLLRTLPVTAAIGTCIGFLLLVGVWCTLGALLGTHRTVVAILGRVSHWLVPVVFIVIGVVILVTTGAYRLIPGAHLVSAS
ncbi:cadmium resistance transporter [Mycolicibacterium sp. CBMA 226]|uniref:cadmium resistance transporter n=1 Tax=Mycolicibacterium sp. CBMA 226 TaxID=2606611 RepID=UPI0012DD14C3|nr:cadmium resistance transporter [Mycolicibacterium sp. CBMA 226]MUL79738.1 cadmium transporter [Mycolicibacterium sp. CBMA 226]